MSRGRRPASGAASARVAGPAGHALVRTHGPVVIEVSLRPGRSGARGAGPLAADLRRYFSGETVDFSRYEVDYGPYSPFERSVLQAARAIPYGETRTYGEVARGMGRPGAARAVGQALGKNRTCIVVPCHRVVAAGGLGGFGAGLAWKRALLGIERPRKR